MATIWEIAEAMAADVAAGRKVVFLFGDELRQGRSEPGAGPPENTYFFTPQETLIATMLYLARDTDPEWRGFSLMDDEWGLNRRTASGEYVWIPLADIRYDPIMNHFYRQSLLAPDKEIQAMFRFEPRSRHLRRIARRDLLLTFIRNYKLENYGQSPTYALMQDAAKLDDKPLSKSVVSADLDYLESQGWIKVHRVASGGSIIIEIPGETITLPDAPVLAGGILRAVDAQDYTGGPEADWNGEVGATHEHVEPDAGLEGTGL